MVNDSDSQSENKPVQRSPTSPDENQTGGNALWQCVLTMTVATEVCFVDLGCLEKHNFQQRCWKTAESITTLRVLRQFS